MGAKYNAWICKITLVSLDELEKEKKSMMKMIVTIRNAWQIAMTITPWLPAK